MSLFKNPYGKCRLRSLGDANGDGTADIVAFRLDAVYVPFAEPKSSRSIIGASVTNLCTKEWIVGTPYSPKHPKFAVDVTGGGHADIVALGQDVVYVIVKARRPEGKYCAIGSRR